MQDMQDKIIKYSEFSCKKKFLIGKIIFKIWQNIET